MADLAQLRKSAREIFDEALRAVDAADAMRRSISRDGASLKVCNLELDLADRPIVSIAIGKAAVSMAVALEDQLGDRFASGLIVGPVAPQPGSREIVMSHRRFSTRWHWHEGGHPLPNKASLLAGSAAIEFLDRANCERALIIFLISGGGSAMMEWPVREDITLANLRAANKALVGCGASISEINSVRRAFSAVKGGKLAARAPDCDQLTLIISDVPKGEEYNVASGPTINPESTAPDAREVIARYNLRRQLPPAMIAAIENPRDLTTESDSLRKQFVLLRNDDATHRAAEAAQHCGFIVEIATDISDAPIAEGCEKLVNRLQELRAQVKDETPVCLISGGEFACPIQGDGVGGRNLESALRLALLRRSEPTDFVALCAGTDGIDGNSLAAGAIVDNRTIDRATTLGFDANDFLRRSDAYSFFAALGDAIITGPTGTNVRDLRILVTS